MVKNKKSQLGNTLSSFFVTLFVVIIMSLYLTIAAGIVLINKPSPPAAVNFDSQSINFLAQKIDLQINNKKEILILDALILYENGIINKNLLEESLKNVLNSRQNCLAIAKGSSENPAGQTGQPASDDIFIKFESENNFLEGNIGNTPLILMQYKQKNLLSKTYFENKKEERIFVEYYLGECI